jgi:GT2 family glycosyltransferase
VKKVQKAEAASSRPLLSVIIISYNTRDMTLECLRVLEAELSASSLSAEVWVVDNASSDGSVDAIGEAFPQVRVIANTANTGFGAANNQAMRQANGEYFLLLNSDAFPRPGALAALVEYSKQHPEAGVVGPRLLNADGSLQRSCWKFPSPARAWLENVGIVAAVPNHPVLGDYSRWEHDTQRNVDFVIGACMLLPRAVYERVGGFDERFFMYSEESDWQRRIHDAGWQVAFTPSAEVTHLGGASGASDKARINRYFFESLDRYERKHHGLAGLVSLRAAMALGCLVRAVAWSLLAAVPRRRNAARAKARLNSWLFIRQTTHWRAASRSES